LAQANWREQSNVDLLEVFKEGFNKTLFGEAAAEVVSKKPDAVEGPNPVSSPQI